ncbi:hypothetical protein C0993_003296, partial [Termitomyces sp. T159_Od127]
MAGLMQNVLKLYGVDSVAINGTIKVSSRDKLIQKFHGDAHPVRTLIFSTVGSAGVNLSKADILTQDQPWSAQDERQIIGRAWRQPQKKTVKVIYLHAEDSADILMFNLARNKEDMFAAFVNKDVAA